MIEDSQKYTEEVAKLYKSADSGYLRLSPEQQLKMQNMRTELVGRQSQRMAAQAAYKAAYKEVNDPKNLGIYKKDYFGQQAERFKNGEVVTDFLDTYRIDTKKQMVDKYKDIIKPNAENLTIKNLGGGKSVDFKQSYSTAYFKKPPTPEELQSTVGEIVYKDLTNPESPLQYSILQDLKEAAQKDPELAKAIQIGDDAKIKQWASKQYSDVFSTMLYKEDNNSSKNITIHTGSGSSSKNPVTIKYYPELKGYSFSGKFKPIALDGEVGGKTYKDAKITGVVMQGGEPMAAISIPKVEDATSSFASGTTPFTVTNKKISGTERNTIYVPFNEVKPYIEQNGYILKDFDKYMTPSPQQSTLTPSPQLTPLVPQ